MKSQGMQHRSFTVTRLQFLILILLVVGIGFRLTNLDHKLYWHDEVYTTLRAAGFMSQEIGKELFQNQMLAPQNLQEFQHFKPGSTAVDTIQSLAIEDPQHPPFYFLMARSWMQIFGSSITASRSLPALLSLLSLPLMYVLGVEVFASPLAALLATALLALSPFDILFSQIARQYSFLTCTVIGSSLLLLRALRLPTWKNWGLYTLVTALGLYTHVLFSLTLIAQGAYVLLLQIFNGSRNPVRDISSNIIQPLSIENSPLTQPITLKCHIAKFFVSVAIALVLYSPWLVVLIVNYHRMREVTGWTAYSLNIKLLIKLWTLSFTCLFLDLDFGIDSLWTYLLRLPVFLLIFAAIYTVCRRTNRRTGLFIATSIFVPFFLLALPDLILGGKRSSVTRYLISCFPGIQLAVGYFLSKKILNGKWIWRGVLALLITGSIASCTVSAMSDTWWSNVPSYFNAEVARRINASSSPLLLSDEGNDHTNLGDLISLSYLLHPEVRLLLLRQPPDLKWLPNQSNAFIFRPSELLRKAVEQEPGQLKLIFPPGQLWFLKRINKE